MNGRWRFDRPEYRTVVVVFLLVYHVGLSFGWSLNDQGLTLLKLRDRVVAVGETHSCSWLGFGCSDSKDLSLNRADPGEFFAYRRLLQGGSRRNPSRAQSTSSPFNRASSIPASISPSESPLSPSPRSNAPSRSPTSGTPEAHKPVVVLPAPQGSGHPVLSPSPALTRASPEGTRHLAPVLAGALSGAFLLLVAAIAVVFLRSNKVVTVKPWATGLSGQLQKAFVTGVPKLNRSEIVVACEDFSNIIGSFSEGTVYKGTLSSGVEIAVTSSAVKSRKDWSKISEENFRKKVEKLSKVNHKNFVSLIGFCEEEEPFTRVMVYEYAPNGTLFEHLHIKEAEHLDWGMRLRIAMGMAYCLDHMHQLTPPIAHRDFHSSSVYLTEDYAAKISDLRFWNEMTSAKMQSSAERLGETPPEDNPESNVYSFGVILFEIITGRIPYSVENCLLADWASEYLKSENSLIETVDPTLKYFNEEQLEGLFQVIKDCVKPYPNERPRMAEVAARLKEITAVGPDGAMPKLSPLWWAELEIVSSDGT